MGLRGRPPKGATQLIPGGCGGIEWLASDTAFFGSFAGPALPLNSALNISDNVLENKYHSQAPRRLICHSIAIQLLRISLRRVPVSKSFVHKQKLHPNLRPEREIK